jgi:hypothetical protein
MTTKADNTPGVRNAAGYRGTSGGMAETFAE